MREGDTVNVFDRAVAAVAPVHAAKRAAARAALKIIDSGYGNYGANLTKKSLRGWEFYGGSAKEDIEDNIDILRQRSRDAYMGIPTASAALKTMRTNVIAGGLMPAPQIDAEFLGLTPEDAEKLQAQIVREFALWADTPVCDADRVDNFYKLQQLTFLSYAMNGDAIVLLPTKEQTGQPYSLRVRLVEADRVCSPDGFGSLFAGAAPVIAAISGIIAVVSILGDHLEDIRGIVVNVFGETGGQVFDVFTGKLQGVADFVTGLFSEGGVAAALAPLQNTITNLFGENAGAAFGGVVTILQSIMGVVGQIVTFATGTVKPIIQDVFTFITGTVLPIILQTFTAAAPTIASIISNIGSAVMTGMQIIGSAIQAAMPIIQGIITVIMTIGSVVVPALLAGFEAFSAGISAVMSAIQGFFQGLITFITGVFSGSWSQAWEGIKQIFGSAFDGLVALCKAPLNAVIAIINKAISGINGLGLTIPKWVPILGGKSFSVNIPTLPMLARGGFTDGVSIAGEAGTEAVISFQRGVRSDNINTWTQAGRMLGVSGEQAAVAAGVPYADGGGAVELATIEATQGNNAVELQEIDTGKPQPEQGGSGTTDGGGQVVFAPQITVQGNADRAVLESVLDDAQQRFELWYEQMMRRKARTAY